MSVIQSCGDTKDTLDLFRPQGLHLKPVARLNISVQLPQLKKSGAKISNWEVMEKAKEMARPYHFPVFKVAKSSLEFIRFEAEIENYGTMESVLAKLDMKSIKLSGFSELLKVRAAEAKTQFPTRHDWDSFFRNNKTMNEMKPGERPDTIHVQNLPTQWFINHQDKSGVTRDKPSEFVVKKVFGTFGEIRTIDIPMLDPYRQKMKSSISGIQTFTFEQDLVFDAYIQYKEYVGFVKAMNSLKGMKLLFKDRYEEKSWVANIKVDFDKTKHLAESTIKKRSQEREKIANEEREREDAERRRRDLEDLKKAEELRKFEEEERDRERRLEEDRRLKMKRRMAREERRRKTKMRKKNQTEEEEMADKIAIEERKLLIAQRKLESIRLLDELLDRVKVVKSKGKKVANLEAELLKTAKHAVQRRLQGERITPPSMTYKDQDEKMLRDKLINRLKQKEVEKMEVFGERLRNARENNRFDSDDEGAGASMEDISDNEFEAGDSDDILGAERIHSDDDLRLTSTDDEVDEDEEGSEGSVGGNSPKHPGRSKSKESKDKKKKKAKKEKKEKKKKRRKSKDDEAGKKRREIATQIAKAQKISDRDRRSRSRERREKDEGFPDYRHRNVRGRRPDRYHEKSGGDETGDRRGYPDYRERIRERKERERMQKKTAEKLREQAKEEIYDQMMNPHLYGFDKRNTPITGSDGMRRPKRGEHYEEVQREYLENEIRIRERREKRREDSRNYDRGYDRYPPDGYHRHSRYPGPPSRNRSRSYEQYRHHYSHHDDRRNY